LAFSLSLFVLKLLKYFKLLVCFFQKDGKMKKFNKKKTKLVKAVVVVGKKSQRA